MGKAGTKKIMLLGVWIALLVGIMVWMNLKPVPSSSPAPMPQLDPAKLEVQWPQIAAHAAAPPRGRADAPYTIAEFGDFQCPQCGKAWSPLEKLLAQYPTKVNLIFLHRPFSQLHQWALPSGQASEIAALQGKFWPMYDVLYTHQDDLEPGFYGDYAAKAGLDKAEFQRAFDAKQGMDKIAAASAFADTLEIQNTPTILVRDNAAKTVSIYVGLDTQGNTKAGISYLALDKLVTAPPWGK